MTSQQILSLLAPPDAELSTSNALLLLNSQFPSLQDLDDLDTSVEAALTQRDNLRSKLFISESNINTLISQTRSLAEEQLHSAQELSLIRHSLSDEISYLSQGLLSSMVENEEGRPTLLEDIETHHRNLTELENVKGYVQIIEHALKLSELVGQQIRRPSALVPISQASLTTYRSLQEFVFKVKDSCLQIERKIGQQNLHLVTFLEKVREQAWADIKSALSSSLLVACERLHWPMPVDYTSVPVEDRKIFEDAFLDLLNLQTIGNTLRPHDGNGGFQDHKDGLYPLQALILPVSARFKYHFEGTRQTNRLDKPEWFFTHVLNVAHEHRAFMETTIQRLLSSTPYRGINAWREFTRMLLPLLSRKLKRTVPALISHPSLLAHTIYQSLGFDASLVEEGFGLAGTSARTNPSGGWDGISDIILGNKEWFEAWIDGERKFAEDQYHEIISSPDAWLITDDDGTEDKQGAIESDLKSTNSARRIKATVEQVTDRYSPLPHFPQRTRFLLVVQLPLLEHYHARIQSSLDAFETLSSVFVRSVPGALGLGTSGGDSGVKMDGGRLTSGVEGVQRLCKALLSANFVEVAMEGWGEELFFLELWTEINHRASLRARAASHPSLPNPQITKAETPDGTIFEELVLQYRKLVIRAEDMIVQQVCGEIEIGLKTHFAAVTSPKLNSDPQDIALSQTLLGPVALLSSHLNFLCATLAPTTLTSLYRRIASRLSEHIFIREIMYRGRGRISAWEAKAIGAECDLWVETCRAALSNTAGRNRIEAPWLKLLQAGRLLSLDGSSWTRVVDETFGIKDNDVWEECLMEVIGLCETGREDVGIVLRLREDCNR